MIYRDLLHHLPFAFIVSSLHRELYVFWSTRLRCNSLKWNSHSASLRLALCSKKSHTPPCPTAGFRLNSKYSCSSWSIRVEAIVLKVLEIRLKSVSEVSVASRKS